MRSWLFVFLIFAQFMLHPVVSAAQSADKVLIFAASSLKDVLDRIVANHPDKSNIIVSYASSGVLARQIEKGAPVDIFISANNDWMDYLIDRELIASDATAIIAENALVVASTDVNLDDASDLAVLKFARFAMGDPAHVPAGIYAKQALENLGLWQDVKQNAIFGENARISLLTLGRGEVDAVIAYQSDVLAGVDFNRAFTFPKGSHQAITYPGGLIGDPSERAVDVFNYLQSDDVKQTFHAAGFQTSHQPGSNVDNSAPKVNYTQIIFLSVQVALVAMVFAVPLAFVVAYILARFQFTGKALVQALVMLPLVMPPVVTGYFLLILFGRQGAIGGFLSQFGITFGFEWTGAALAAGVMAFPLLVRPMRLAIELVDKGIDDAAKTLGASFWVRLITIIIPLSLPGIIAGAVLGFAKALGEFGATITFVSNIPGETQTFSLAIYSLLQSPTGDQAALILVGISVGIAICAVFISELIVSNMSHRETRDA